MLAREVQACDCVLAACLARVMLCVSHPLRKKGRREDRAPAGTHKTPMLNRCTRNAQGRHRATETSGLPCAVVLTAYAALSPETSSFCLRRDREIHGNAPVDALTPSQKLDRSNDGQDHTVSPYAGNPASPRGFAGHGRRSSIAVRAMLTRFISPCTHKPPLTPPASTATQPASVTTYDRPFGGLGWPTHTTNPNFGKVEYFSTRALTENRTVCRTGTDWPLVPVVDAKFALRHVRSTSQAGILDWGGARTLAKHTASQ